MGHKLPSLFLGLGYAALAGYKVPQRIYKFGGQPWIDNVPTWNYKTSFTNMFGERKGRMMIQATPGSVTGTGEVVLLPLDEVDVLTSSSKSTLTHFAFRGRGVIKYSWRLRLRQCIEVGDGLLPATLQAPSR